MGSGGGRCSGGVGRRRDATVRPEWPPPQWLPGFHERQVLAGPRPRPAPAHEAVALAAAVRHVAARGLALRRRPRPVDVARVAPVLARHRGEEAGRGGGGRHRALELLAERLVVQVAAAAQTAWEHTVLMAAPAEGGQTGIPRRPWAHGISVAPVYGCTAAAPSPVGVLRPRVEAQLKLVHAAQHALDVAARRGQGRRRWAWEECSTSSGRAHARAHHGAVLPVAGQDHYAGLGLVGGPGCQVRGDGCEVIAAAAPAAAAGV